MSYCLNPECSQPQNPLSTQFCLNCGSALRLLKGRYQVMQLISNTSGCARTYLGLDRERGEAKCAIKHLVSLPKVQGNAVLYEKAIALFEQEAQRLTNLDAHPQIPSLWDFFQEENQRYLVQEFIPGQNLAQCLQQNGPFTEAQIRNLLQGLLPVLQFIHNRQIIHRDIKPANLMLRQGLESAPEGFVLIDFGISKQLAQTAIAQTGTVGIGTQGYAPLEQMLTGKTYPASDLYSLGVTGLCLLTGVEPDRLYDPSQGRWLWRETQLQGNPISENLGGVLDKLTQVAIGDRYQSAQEALNDLNSSPYNLPTITQASEDDPEFLDAPPLVVAKLGPANYRTLNEAIKNALPYTIIKVRAGFYAESLRIDKPLQIMGEGNKEDIIIESQLAPCVRMEGDRALIRGVTFHYRNWTQIHRADLLGRFMGQRLHSPYAISITHGNLTLEECTIHGTGLANIYIKGKNTNATLRRCEVAGDSQYGVWMTQDSRSSLEFCQIYGQTIGVKSDRHAEANLEHCQISQMTGEGILVSEAGHASASFCDIFQNGGRGVHIKKQSNLSLKQCRLYGNQKQGIYVASNGAGPIEQCDLRGNEGGPWWIAPRCAVARRGNIET